MENNKMRHIYIADIQPLRSFFLKLKIKPPGCKKNKKKEEENDAQ